MSRLFVILSLSVMVLAASAALRTNSAQKPKNDDLIESLPGLNITLPFDMYSGYLKTNGEKQLHYWYVESAGNPDKDPLVLWMNGGPGCSSLDGLLSEHGPVHVNTDGSTLSLNPYSWNLLANVLYLEAPAGVGFSYSDNTSDYEHYNDLQVADDNYHALLSFFSKFPLLRGRDFFVTGESYGGVYVPTLVTRILQAPSGEFPFALQGLAVGNGLQSYSLNDNSLVFFGYYHGLYGNDQWMNLTTYCCADNECNFHNPTDADCISAVTTAMNIVYTAGLNFYALYLPCYHNSATRMSYDMKHLFTQLPKQENNAEALRGTVPCIDSHASAIWLNTPAVRKALHIREKSPKWSICNDLINEKYNRTYQTVVPLYPNIIKSGVRVLNYVGDTDMACNFLGNEWAVDSLNYEVSMNRRTWTVNDQVAGFVKQWANGQLTYATVKGAGHMVPQWKPAEALHMIQSFLNNTPY